MCLIFEMKSQKGFGYKKDDREKAPRRKWKPKIQKKAIR